LLPSNAGVVGISEIIIKPGLVNVDFADVRTIMGNAGTALMVREADGPYTCISSSLLIRFFFKYVLSDSKGIGQGKGKNRAIDAAMSAISSPLLDFPISKGAQ
jgi:cell division protein FtsZ